MKNELSDSAHFLNTSKRLWTMPAKPCHRVRFDDAALKTDGLDAILRSANIIQQRTNIPVSCTLCRERNTFGFLTAGPTCCR